MEQYRPTWPRRVAVAVAASLCLTACLEEQPTEPAIPGLVQPVADAIEHYMDDESDAISEAAMIGALLGCNAMIAEEDPDSFGGIRFKPGRGLQPDEEPRVTLTLQMILAFAHYESQSEEQASQFIETLERVSQEVNARQEVACEPLLIQA